ncbi:P-loop NTPase fold protein [Mycoplasma sp. SG1]|uniref:P-loop NTPase fold protein n=1 Tax=Mycoplasma sp. SG1 TaxID=2810348 RepID=UPI0020244E87|nr:P-loop NTPase fold protein [Mycoplasma sp. SG1]URM52987.1 KAP family NTPase [Mycoplasma sp. SG1]
MATENNNILSINPIDNLSKHNDKISMIDYVIRPINEYIHDFFKNKNAPNSKPFHNVFNINGGWGSGKTTIIQNLTTYYKKSYPSDDINFKILNLWECELYVDPARVILDIINFIDTSVYDEKDKISTTSGEKITKKGILVLKSFWYHLSGSYTYEKVKENSRIKHPPRIDELINGYIEELNNNTKNKSIVFIFDELERCTPENQIKILSIIKNIFWKVTNIFWIVVSNNKLINQHINGNLDINLLKLTYNEKYTDKIFPIQLDLDNIYPEIFIDNFTDNKYIKEFCNKVNISSLKLNIKLIIQVNNLFNSLKNKNEFEVLFKEYKSNSKEAEIISIQKDYLELIIFYCYYLKYEDNKEYKELIKLTDSHLLKSNFLHLFINNIIVQYRKKAILDTDKFPLETSIKSLITKGRNTDDPYITIDRINYTPFKLDYFLNDRFNDNNLKNWFFGLIPFFGSHLTTDNISQIFSIEEGSTNQLHIVIIKKEYLLYYFPTHKKCFFNIFFRYIKSEIPFSFFSNGNDHLKIITYSKISKLIKDSILDRFN